jgi:signal transduction histidine kinase
MIEQETTMAELTSARPRRETVPTAQHLGGRMLDSAQARRGLAKLSASRLEIAAIAHLALLAAVEFKSSTGGASSMLVLTGVVLVLLALMHNGGVFSESLTLPFAHDSVSDSRLQPIPVTAGRILSSTEIALERQSQRLVEIADSAVRSKLQSDQRSQTFADLTHRVSHELRTPLNAVIGFTDLMRSEVMGPIGHPRYVEYLDHIRDSGRTLLKSAEDTLALTALLAGPNSASVPEVLNFEDFATDAWTFSSADASARSISFEMVGLDGLEILAERRPLRQILINLYSCALARAASGSSLSLSATTDGDVVEVVLTLSTVAADAAHDAGCLSLNLARALLELQDTFLIEPPAPSGGWRVVTVFAAANQADLFI